MALCVEPEILTEPCEEIAFPGWELSGALLGGLKVSLEHYLPLALADYQMCASPKKKLEIGKGNVCFTEALQPKKAFVRISVSEESIKTTSPIGQSEISAEGDYKFLIEVHNPAGVSKVAARQDCGYIDLQNYKNAVIKVLAVLRQNDLFITGETGRNAKVALNRTITVKNPLGSTMAEVTVSVEASERSKFLFR